MQKIQVQPAYVLHARAYRESSQLLEVLSRDYGRVGMVARGARGSRSRWKGMLQPFRPLLLNWSRRGELASLTGAEQVAAPPPLVGDVLYCGLYLNELTLRLLMRDDPHPEVFEQYGVSLGELLAGAELQPCLRLFEKHLLDATGFGLILDREPATGEALCAERWYEYQPERGPVRVSETARHRAGVVSGRALLGLHAGEIDREHWPQLRTLMRRVLRRQLGDRPLASESLYRALRRPQTAAAGVEPPPTKEGEEP